MTSQQIESLFKEHYNELGCYALKFLRCEDKSDEVVQSVFIKLWNKKDDIGEVKNWKSYLFFSVKNACIDLLRKNKNNELDLDDNSLVSLNSDSSTSEGIEAEELEYYIEQALKTLPEKCYSVFSLKRFAGLTNAQVAEELGITPKTVENQFTIAIKKIKEYLAQYGLP